MAAVAYPFSHDRGYVDHAIEPYLLPDATERRPGSLSRPAAVYRRRRLVALLALVATLWLAAAAVGGITTALRGLGSRPLTTPELAGAGQPTPALAAPAVTHVVQPGDTVWAIARELRPSGDIRPLVDRLVAERGGRPLQVGEVIVLR